MADSADLQIVDNPDLLRYEARLGDRVVGIAEYEHRDGRIVFVHTEVLPDAKGLGVGSRLAKGALDDVRTRGLRAIVECPFIAAYIKRHPEYDDLVDDSGG